MKLRDTQCCAFWLWCRNRCIKKSIEGGYGPSMLRQDMHQSSEQFASYSITITIARKRVSSRFKCTGIFYSTGTSTPTFHSSTFFFFSSASSSSSPFPDLLLPPFLLLLLLHLWPHCCGHHSLDLLCPFFWGRHRHLSLDC